MHHDALHRLGATTRQRAGIRAVAERHGEATVEVAQQLAQGAACLGGDARTRDDGRQTRKRRQA